MKAAAPGSRGGGLRLGRMRIKTFVAPLLLAALLGACATASRNDAPASLARYYASLDRARLPVAPAGPALSTSAPLTRIAFGSCVNQDRPQGFWASIAATDPGLFLMIGDNVYGDTRATWAADMPTLTRAYARLSERVEFRDFRSRVPMMATWDDHDYGANDAGGSFAFKQWAETVFETYWGSSAAVRARPGVHDSVIVGPAAQRVQIIMLDTRFFRSDLATLPYQDPAPPLGWYTANADRQATMLGDAQWAWLEAELAKPADLRLIVSSIQVTTHAHNFEKWGNFPAERERLLQLLAARGIGNAVLLTGDRHLGGLYRAAVPGPPRSLWEITSSSLNFSFARDGKDTTTEREPDPLRLGRTYPEENFGLIEIDWTAKRVTLGLRGSDGGRLALQVVAFGN